MAVVEDTAAAAPGAPSAPIPQRTYREPRQRRLTISNLLRFMVLGALAAFLLYYVGPRNIAETTIKVVAAVALTAALWIGANILFDQAYAHWTRFNTIVGVVLGFLGFFVAEANGLMRTLFDRRVHIAGQGVFDDVTGWRTRPLDVNALLWGLIGGAALGLVLFVLSAPRRQLARLPLAVVGFVGFGLLSAYALDDSAWPVIDWSKLWISVAVGAALFGLAGLVRAGRHVALLSLITGAGVGWFIGAWGGGDVGRGNFLGAVYATVVPAAILGVRFGMTTQPDARRRRTIERRSRAWIFVTPAMFFIVVGLLVPLLRTVYLSFHNRNGRENVGFDNYREIFTNKNSVNLTNWEDVFTSRLLWIALALIGIGVLAGIIAGRRTSQSFERGPGSFGLIFVGFFILSCAILSTIRGTVFNNIWWVVVVVTLATVIGLAVAVLADRAKGENAAKSLIFLPMAVSFIGAGIIWRFVYQAREVSQQQTGVLNALWVWIGEVSTSTTSRIVAVAVLAVIALGLIYLIKSGLQAKSTTSAAFSAGFLLLIGYLVYRLLGPGLGGFVKQDGVVEAKPVLFIQEAPFNNVWLMVVLIWVQTGFAMVILSAAIKAVPTELTEAAKMDGASESQIFWRITLPQIAPTLGVVITALFVTVMKVFDIVYAMTNGSFGTQVIANEMFQRAFGFSDLGLGSALAVVLFLSVIPVMWVNVRRIQGRPADDGDVDRQPRPAGEDRAATGASSTGSSARSRRGCCGCSWSIWSIPTLGLLVNSVRTREEQRSSGWWTVFSGQRQRAHPRQLPPGPRHDRRRRHEAGAHQLVRHRPAGDDHPDRLRRLRRLRVRVDRLQAPPGPVHRHGRAAGVPLQVALIPLLQMYVARGALDDPVVRQDDHALPRTRPRRDDHRGLAHAHRVRHAVRHLPVAQLHLVAAQGPLRVGPHRRGRPLQDLLPVGPPAVGAGPRGVRHLPVPVDLERLPDRRHDGRRQRIGARRRRS